MSYSFASKKAPWDYMSTYFIEGKEERLPLDSLKECEPGIFGRFPADIVAKSFKGINAHHGPNAWRWIIQEVTRGCVRSNKNKVVWVFNRAPSRPMTQSQFLDLIKRMNNYTNWVRLDQNAGFELIESITRCCNEVKDKLLCELSNRRVPHPKRNELYLTQAMQVRITNLAKLPEFVTFQKRRDYMHKQNAYHYTELARGGNQGKHKVVDPMPNPMSSVHQYLYEYHSYLGSFKNKDEGQPCASELVSEVFQ